MCTHFCDFTLVKHHNLVSITDGGKAVCHHDNSFSFVEIRKVFGNGSLIAGIKGIGGSDLGPVMVYEALKPFADAGITARFVSNIDPVDLGEKTEDLDPETTLFVIVSKTFTTLETLTNARCARTWLLEKLAEQGVIDGSDAQNAEAIRKHFVAVSTALDLVEDFGIDPQNAFGFWNWVGGRYSVDSAVGLVLAIVFGPQRFAEFLSGFNAVDEYFKTTPLRQNVVALMGLLNVWYHSG